MSPGFTFDRLGEAEIATAIEAAHGVLVRGGLLCSAGLGEGTGPISRTTIAVWRGIYRLDPFLVGGCRPVELAQFVDSALWRITRRMVVVGAMVPSEIVVAEAL